MSDTPTPRADNLKAKAVPAKRFSQEMLVVGLGYIMESVPQLERELAEANRRACEYYLTDESVMVMDSPEAVREARKKAAKRMIDMEHELTEAREGWRLSNDQTQRAWRELAEALENLEAVKREVQRLRIVNDALDESDELAEARKQRDTLVEALEMIITHNLLDNQCDNGYPPRYVAKKALATVKGGDA
jgi:sugar-specific transcriptional regulator TrmB